MIKWYFNFFSEEDSMPFLHNFEDQTGEKDALLEKNESTYQELLTQVTNLQDKTKELFDTLGICPEQFAAFIENPANFSTEEWEAIEAEKKKLDEKLDLSLDHVRDPIKAQKNFEDFSQSRNWLFVR